MSQLPMQEQQRRRLGGKPSVATRQPPSESNNAGNSVGLVSPEVVNYLAQQGKTVAGRGDSLDAEMGAGAELVSPGVRALMHLFSRTQDAEQQIYVTLRGVSTGVSVLAIEIMEAYDIAYGHSWSKRRNEWMRIEINNGQELAEHLENIMTKAGGDDVAELPRGRTIYWDGATGTLIIENPNETDGGTVYRPDMGRAEFEELRIGE